MRTLAALLILLLILVAVPVAAQDTTEPTCTPDQWQAFQDGLTQISSTLATSASPLDDVYALNIMLSEIQSTCGGGIFSKADYPNGIVGPVTFDGTLYEATLESNGSIAVLTPKVIDGNCGDFMFEMPTMTDISGGTNGAIWEFNACTAIFAIEAPMAQDWSLTIQRLR